MTTDDINPALKQSFVDDGIAHAKEARSAPYTGPKLMTQEKILVEGRDGQPVSIPQRADALLGRAAVQDVEPTDPQSIFNQAMALSGMAHQAIGQALVTATTLLHNDLRPSKAVMSDLLEGLDELATRTVQLRHSLSTHA